MAGITEIVAQLAEWHDADDETRFPSSVRYWCVNEAIRQIVRTLGVRFGEQSTTFSVVAGTDTYELPDRWIKPIRVWYYDTDGTYVDLGDPADKKEFDEEYPEGTDQDDVEAYVMFGNDIILGPPPSRTFTLYADYYGGLEDLEKGGSNVVTENAPGVVFWKSMLISQMFFPGEEARLPLWHQAAEDGIAGLVVESAANRRGNRRPESRIAGRKR